MASKKQCGALRIFLMMLLWAYPEANAADGSSTCMPSDEPASFLAMCLPEALTKNADDTPEPPAARAVAPSESSLPEEKAGPASATAPGGTQGQKEDAPTEEGATPNGDTELARKSLSMPVLGAFTLLKRDGLSLFAQIFGRYEYIQLPETSTSRFELRRADVAGRYGFGPLAAMVRLEGVRSAGPDSYFGIDQNSFVLRVKHAYAEVIPEWDFLALRVRAGIVPDVWIEALQRDYDVRAFSPFLAERGTFFEVADLGASAALALWGGRITAKFALTNGEGYRQVELNGGKDATFVLSLRPLPDLNSLAPFDLALHFVARDGSRGYGSTRDHRLGGAVTWRHPWIAGGIEYTYAFGYAGQATREASGLGVFANGILWPDWLGFALRYDRNDAGVALGEAATHDISLALVPGISWGTAKGMGRARLFCSGQATFVEKYAGPVGGVPEASQSFRLMAIFEATGFFHVP